MTLHHYQDEHGLDTTVIAATADEPSGVEPPPREENQPEVTGTKHGH
jgi:hypothetical protein